MDIKHSLLLLLYILCVQGEYTLKLRLIEYNNPTKKLANGDCCDGLWQCKDCDPIFTGCLTDRQMVQKPCNLGSFETREYSNMNRVKFNSSLGTYLRNPIVLRSWLPWTGNVSLRIEVTDNDLFGEDWVMNEFGMYDLNFLKLGANSSLSTEIVLSHQGPQKSSLHYGIRVHCSKYFYGANCTKYCKPEDDDIKGHFVCNEHGDKICRKGFIGKDCLSAPTTTQPIVTTLPPTTLPGPICGGTINASIGSVSIFGKNLQNNLDTCDVIHCHWKIILPQGQSTKLWFSEFFPGKHNLKCIQSMVTITVMSEVLTFYCSDIPPGNGQVRVKENEVEIDAIVAPSLWSLNSGFTLNFEPWD